MRLSCVFRKCFINLGEKNAETIKRADSTAAVSGNFAPACEEWAKVQGCWEFSGNTELDNAEGLAFHAGAGFCETNRVVCFVKNL